MAHLCLLSFISSWDTTFVGGSSTLSDCGPVDALHGSSASPSADLFCPLDAPVGFDADVGALDPSSVVSSADLLLFRRCDGSTGIPGCAGGGSCSVGGPGKFLDPGNRRPLASVIVIVRPSAEVVVVLPSELFTTVSPSAFTVVVVPLEVEV